MTADIADHDHAHKTIAERAQARLDALAKPQGSLGELERLAVRLCEASGTVTPQTRPRSLVIFAADHGCVASGVSLWPSAVTGAVARTVLNGKAASSVMARETGTQVKLVDVGMVTDIPGHPDLIRKPIRRGTRNFVNEPALTLAEFEAAMEAGADVARAEIAAGARLLIAGEIGIGNTTAAAAIIAHLCGLSPEQAAGSGAGATPASMAAKTAAIASALARAGGAVTPNTIASMTGLEIAAIAGFQIAAAEAGIPTVIDGAITTAAALIAAHLSPSATSAMIASHLSTEPAHAAALAKLSLTPALQFGMRLGEGTGALALLPLLDLAAAIINDMGTLQEAVALIDG
jgi:nicotinate-nucleotide--dimethylbenzimidazole phosphoribosyltransferase